MLNREANRNGATNGNPLDPWKFGAPGRDPVEIGRRGGQKSGLSRRLRSQRQLEEKIASSKNGAAIFGLYRTQIERERALEVERRRLDETVCRLMDEADLERGTIAHLKQRRREWEVAATARAAALEAREQELRGRLESDEGLVAWLAEVGEERVERAAAALGWIEEEPEVVASEA